MANIRKFTPEDLDVKTITFKGKDYKVGGGSYKRSELSSNFFRVFVLKNGLAYAYNKINHVCYPTH